MICLWVYRYTLDRLFGSLGWCILRNGPLPVKTSPKPRHLKMSTWGVPEIGLPLVIIHLIGFSEKKTPFGATPIYGNPHIFLNIPSILSHYYLINIPYIIPLISHINMLGNPHITTDPGTQPSSCNVPKNFCSMGPSVIAISASER